MSTAAITYAIVGGPPKDWACLRIIDTVTGKEVREVVEINTLEGWLIRLKRSPEGKLCLHPFSKSPKRERITGSFRIERRAAPLNGEQKTDG